MYMVESVILNLKFEWLCKILTKIENILKHRSVAQADSNNEIKSSKISLDYPFNLKGQSNFFFVKHFLEQSILKIETLKQ